MFNSVNTEIIGHVVIKEKATRKTVVDKSNAVHPKNMAQILARALAHEDNSWVHTMAFGNGRNSYLNCR